MISLNKHKKILILGGGELSKEIAISSLRLGIKCISIDSYGGSPASYICSNLVCDMFNYNKLLGVIEEESPDCIICEKESINIELIINIEKEGYNIIPNSKSIEVCMDKELLRNLANDLNIRTTKYNFANRSLEELTYKIEKTGFPCIIKPCFSSSGKGQSIVHNKIEIARAYKELSQSRGTSSRIIIEEFINFVFEVTILVTKQKDKLLFSPPIIHKQKKGDFYLSYQQKNLISQELQKKCENICNTIIMNLCNFDDNGVFGVEFFIKIINGELEPIFNEMSPRPHDTGIITLKSQNYSQFDLLLYSIFNINIGEIKLINDCISHSLVIKNNKNEDIRDYEITLENKENVFYYHFLKPIIKKKSTRRVGLIIYYCNNKNYSIEIEMIESLCQNYTH